MRSIIFCVAVFCVVLYGAWACDRQICASIVSRCQLIKACECNMEDKRNCSCCYNCQLCLSNLYQDCCSCVGMCPLPDPEDSIFKTSAIEILSDPIPDLFNVLTEEEDYLKRWTTFRYPIYFDAMYSRETNMEPGLDQTRDSRVHAENQQQNCTVAFMSDCMAIGRCKQSCRSMGAAKYRWFHDEGCCQCIGKPCQDFGLNDAKCLKCQTEDDNDNYTPGEDQDEDTPVKNMEEPHRHRHHHHQHHQHEQATENN